MLLDFFRIKQSFFFFNDTATTEIYTLSLHDALPISRTPPTSTRSFWPTFSRRSATGSTTPAVCSFRRRQIGRAHV